MKTDKYVRINPSFRLFTSEPLEHYNFPLRILETLRLYNVMVFSIPTYPQYKCKKTSVIIP